MPKFAWPVFFAAAAAVVVVSVGSFFLFKRFVNKDTGEVESRFVGAKGPGALTGYKNVQS